MAVIFVFEILYLGTFCATGFALFSLLKYKARNPFLSFFMGVFVFGLLGEIFSLFIPLDVRVLLICFAPALCGVIPMLRGLRRAAISNKLFLIYSLVFLCVWAALFAFTSSWKTWPAISYDTDLYHVQVVRWLNTYGTVPGIGNLHNRFANGSMWLVISAMLNYWPVQGKVAWCMNPMWLTALTAYFMSEIWSSECLMARMYALCSVFVPVYANIIWGFPNLYHDFPSLSILLVIGSEMIYFLYGVRNNDAKDGLILCTCVSLSFLIKPLSVVSTIIIPSLVVYRFFDRGKMSWSRLVFVLSLSIAAACILCVRNVIMSGYPLFPVSKFLVAVDWAMSSQSLLHYVIDVRAWARMSSSDYLEAFNKGIFFWFLPWMKHTLSGSFSILMLGPLCLGGVAWAFTWRRLSGFKDWGMFVWPVASIVYWFWFAPDPRFGLEFFWIFFALGMAFFARSYQGVVQQAIAKFSSMKILVGLTFEITFCLLVLLGGSVLHHRKQSSFHMEWISTGVISPRQVKKTTITRTGSMPFTIYTPENGDQCGDANLPCTPEVNEHLVMRKKGDLGAGFRLEE